MIHEHAYHGATGVCHRNVTLLLAQWLPLLCAEKLKILLI